MVVFRFKAEPKFPPTYSTPSFGPIFPGSNPLSLLPERNNLFDILTSSSDIELIALACNEIFVTISLNTELPLQKEFDN